MIASRLTRKARTTILQPVLAALGLRAGDTLGYNIEAGRVILTRAGGQPVDESFDTFGEWNSEADRRAYAAL